jgi:hypothetical protein
MEIALTVIAFAAALLLYTAWVNGVFRRCPHCRKIGSWRFDAVEPPSRAATRTASWRAAARFAFARNVDRGCWMCGRTRAAAP